MLLSCVEKYNNEQVLIELHAKHKSKKTAPKELPPSFFEKLKNIFKSIGNCFAGCFRCFAKTPSSLKTKQIEHVRKPKKTRSSGRSRSSELSKTSSELKPPKKNDLPPKQSLLEITNKYLEYMDVIKNEIAVIEYKIQNLSRDFCQDDSNNGRASVLLRELRTLCQKGSKLKDASLVDYERARIIADRVCFHFFISGDCENLNDDEKAVMQFLSQGGRVFPQENYVAGLEQASTRDRMSSCLEWLCRYGCIETIQCLIRSSFYEQAMVNGGVYYTKYNPLCAMAEIGSELSSQVKVQIADILLKKWPELLNRECLGKCRTPLEVALDGGLATLDGSANHPTKPGYYVSVQFVQCLLNSGADVSKLSGEHRAVLSHFDLLFGSKNDVVPNSGASQQPIPKPTVTGDRVGVVDDIENEISHLFNKELRDKTLVRDINSLRDKYKLTVQQMLDKDLIPRELEVARLEIDTIVLYFARKYGTDFLDDLRPELTV